MTTEWPEVELRRVIDLDIDAFPIEPSVTYEMVGVYSFGRGLFYKESVRGMNTSYKKFYRLKPEHIVMSQLFGWEGALALSSEEFEGKYVSPQFPTFVTKPQLLEREFLGWFSKRPLFWDELGKRAKGMGDRRRTLNPESLLSCTIPLPPLPEQRRIVAKIECLATKIDEAKKLKTNVSEEIKALSKSHLSSIFSKLSSKWGKRSLIELIVKSNYGTSTKCFENRDKGTYPVLRIPNIANEKVDSNNMKYGFLSQNEFQNVDLREGDLLVVRTNGSADLVGRCAVVPKLSEPTAFASYLIRLRCDARVVIPDFLQLVLRNLRDSGDLFNMARTTAGQYNVSLGRLNSAEIPIPPIEEQRSVVASVSRFETEIEALKKCGELATAELDALLPSILDKAFKGEL